MDTSILRSEVGRRHFIKACSLASFAAVSGCGSSRKANPQGYQKVDEETIVVGAGVAGLAAARSLTSQGFRVTILEGRERIGGRIWTDRSLGIPLDLGASWIHGIRRNPLTDISNDAGIRTVKTDFDAIKLYDIDGTALVDDDLDDLEELFEQIFEDLLEAKRSAGDNASIAGAVSSALARRDLSDAQRRGVEWVIASEIELEAAADLDELSLRNWDEDDAFKGDDVLFPEGYAQVPEVLAEGLDIHLDHLVSEIACDERGVAITTNRGVFRGDRAVITLPLGVLREGTVRFSPVLPDSKLSAIQDLQMGTLNKIAMRFGERFWPAEPHFLGYLDESAEEAMNFLNMFPYDGEPALMAFARGAHARSLEQLSTGDVTEQVMAQLRGMFGNSISDPTNATFTRWHGDPFARGSYSHVPPGGSMADYEELAQPVGDRLFFAGEATTRRYPGTVHGALLSGEREAERIVQRAIS